MPTTPVAKPARAEDARQRRPARLDDQRGVAGQDAGARLAPRIFAGEHRVAGRRAGGGRRMRVGETDAFARQPIDVRRLDARGAVGGDVAVAEVVGVDQDDVRPGLGCRHRGRERRQRGCGKDSRCHRRLHARCGPRPVELSDRRGRASIPRVPHQRRRIVAAVVFCAASIGALHAAFAPPRRAPVAIGQAAARAGSAPPRKRPNIVWISNEDMSPRLGAYGDALARTPVLDRLARESVRYTQGVHDGAGLRAQPRRDHHRHVPDDARRAAHAHDQGQRAGAAGPVPGRAAVLREGVSRVPARGRLLHDEPRQDRLSVRRAVHHLGRRSVARRTGATARTRASRSSRCSTSR